MVNFAINKAYSEIIWDISKTINIAVMSYSSRIIID